MSETSPLYAPDIVPVQVRFLSTDDREQAALDPKTKQAREAAESLFMSMMIKEMRGNMTEDGLFGGEGSDIYGGMFDMFMGQSLAEGEPLGLFKSLTQADSKPLDLSKLSTVMNPANGETL